MNAGGFAAPGWRGFLSSRPGALLQIAAIVAGALVLPGGSLLAPLLLALIALVLLWLAGDDRQTAGFGRPTRRAFWCVAAGVLVGFLWQYAAVGVLVPLAGRWLEGSAPSGAAAPGGALGFVVSVLAFGAVHPLAKGLAYRGFLLSRLERLFGASIAGVVVSVVLASIVFGLGNLYQGLAGVAVGALTGAVFNALYYWARRNVWSSVLAHAVYNITALTLLYLGTI
jgi:membrane protease YdiL (CAAX protease family)